MARRSQPQRLSWPLTPEQLQHVDDMFQELYDDTDNGSLEVSIDQITSGILSVSRGGTGLDEFVVGDLLYADDTDSLAALADVATGNALISGGVGVAPAWGKIALSTHVSGTLPVANGGTNIASYTIGDLLYASASGVLSVLADVAAGSYMRSGGVATAPLWSTLTLPNASAQGDIFISTAANVMTVLAKNTTATRYLSNTGTSNNPAWAQINLTNGVTGNLPVANLGNGSITKITSSVTGTNNNLALGVVGDTYCEWSGASDATFTGVTGGAVGLRLIIKNTGSKVLYFAHQSGSSSAANQFTNIVTSSTTPIAAGGSITYVHNGTNWILVQHEQGAAITPTFSASDYFATGATWTVASGDVVNFSWKLTGKMLQVNIWLDTTTFSGTASVLSINIPNSYTRSVPSLALSFQFVDNGVTTTAIGYAPIASSTEIRISRLDGANFTASTDNTYVRGTVFLEIT